MREIKFRAWDDMTGEMEFNPKLHMKTEGLMAAVFGYSGECSHVHLMQYTGLHDKNGVEIYEGDIVRLHKGVAVVVWQAPCFVMKAPISRGRLSSSWSSFILAPTENQFEEVIGNIHQNPELLK